MVTFDELRKKASVLIDLWRESRRVDAERDLVHRITTLGDRLKSSRDRYGSVSNKSFSPTCRARNDMLVSYVTIVTG